jgi:hypothetical protein
MAHIQEKHEKQSIAIVDKFPMLYDVSENVMLGSFSWYYMQSKHKNIMRRFALNFDGTIATPGELARTYLELKYKKVRATGEQVREFQKARSAPLYAKPHHYQEGVYVDIRSAYWQLLQIVGWDADYYPGKWLGRGTPMDDFPYADIKLSRNCLVTAGLPSEATFWKGSDQKFKRLSTFNRSSNLGIWALIMDVLHGIAWDCVAAGATYAHTDGYICEVSRLSAVMGAIADWGLEARVKKVGEVSVYGVGSYSFPNDKTNTPKQNHAYDGLLLPDYNQWLKKRFKFFSERTNLIWVSTYQPEKS